MRKTLVLTGVLLTVCAASSWALKNTVESRGSEEWEALLQYDLLSEPGGPIASHSDTAYFGGSGLGNGTVVRGGIWDWEANSGEAPQFFLDGDPVGNQFRDGYTFEDRTTRNGPSQVGAGHWSPTGVYNFSDDGGAFAHRATTHNATGPNQGPTPLNGSSWSIWIGTNLYLNPENCGWGQVRGYSDGWSQGIQKAFTVPTGNAVYAISFFHRYAVEAGFDTDWVEISTDGVNFGRPGPGIFNGGDSGEFTGSTGPLPAPAGGAGAVALGTINPAGGTLYVRFRLASDAFFSDNNESGDFKYGWQLDDIQLTRNAVNVGAMSTFETGLDGWELRRFEGFDYLQTGNLRPVGRIVNVSDLACPPVAVCPGGCLQGNILVFIDKDDCDINDSFQDSYATSPAFAIGGPTLPDLDGDSGRLYQTSLYVDGGASNAFETGPAICYVYWPLNANRCAPSGYTPPAGDPGAGITFNWKQTDFGTCDFFSQGAGTTCIDIFNQNASAAVPAAADSLILHIGAFSQCRSDPACDTADNGAPFYDDVRWGIFNPAGVVIASASADLYSDNYPVAEGSFLTQTARMDGAHSFSQNLNDIPLRWVRSDTAVANCGAAAAAVFLRFRVTPGPCQPNLNHAFFTAYPPNVWNSARMDTARVHGTGQNSPGRYMTCFHELDPRNGTCWAGQTCPGVEPCDDILPDALFTAGTKVQYFFEVRNNANNALLGTFPFGRNNRAIGTGPEWSDFWLESTTLPELLAACNGTQAHNLLVVNDAQSVVQRGRLTDILSSLGLDFDVYDSVGANFGSSYNGIGRREDLVAQPPRPPFNGATDQQIEGYDCIWYFSGILDFGTLSDQTDEVGTTGGQPSNDQQRLETWIDGCTGANNRLLVLEGSAWAADIAATTDNGPTFLTNRGVGVLTDDYAQDLAANDQRRCARVTGTTAAGAINGEVFGSGCPDDVNMQVLAAGNGGVARMNYVESHELANDPITCGNDTNQPTWHAVVRRQDGVEPCERSVSMAFPYTFLYALNCTDECLFDNFIVTGDNVRLAIDQFIWAGKLPPGTQPIGVEEPSGAPRLVNALYQAEPNPANPSAKIRYTIAEKGRVTLRIFDVSGRLVRTLVDEVKEATAAGYEVVWDGKNDAGQRVGSGVFFYQIDTGKFASAKKLVILK